METKHQRPQHKWKVFLLGDAANGLFVMENQIYLCMDVDCCGFPICLCWIRSLLHHSRGVTVQSLHVSKIALSGHVVVSMGNIILHHWCLGYHVFGQAHNDFELNSCQFSHVFPEKTDAEVFGTVFATVIAPMFGTQPREVQEGTSRGGTVQSST